MLRSYKDIPLKAAPLQELTFYSLLTYNAENNTPFIKYYSGERLLQEYDYKQFLEDSLKLAFYLHNHHKIDENIHVGIMMHNSINQLLAYSALWLLGAVAVPLDPQQDLNFNNFVLKDANVQLLLTEMEYDNYSDTVSLHTNFIQKLPNSKYTPKAFDHNNTAVIIYTSGTTGNPKGVELTLFNLMVNAKGLKKHHKLDSSQIHMCVLPLFHVNALCFSFFTILYSKAQLILNKNFSMFSFWSITKDEKVNTINVAPTIVEALLLRKSAPSLPHLKYITSAAAPLNINRAKEFYKTFNIMIIQGYGLSEAVNFSLTTPILNQQAYEEDVLNQEHLTIGVPIEGNEIFIIKDNTILQENQIGELCIRGWNVMKGYFKNEEVTRTTFEYEYLHTGDVGYFKVINGQKYFYITGREKELIIKNGENLSPFFIECQIREIEGLEQACIIGFPNQFSGEEIGLYLINKNNLSKEQIIQLVDKKLEAKLMPKEIIFTQSIEQTATGKIKRRLISQKFNAFKDINYK